MVSGLNDLNDGAELLTLPERVDLVHARIASACGRARVDPESVSLLAVTKKHDPERVVEIVDAGIRSMGESRVQEAAQKIPLCPGNIEWHFIGHLQSNKANAAVALFEMIHSVDSTNLLDSVDAAAAGHGRRMSVCLQVNVSGEGSKFGFDPEEIAAVLEHAQTLVHVNVVGLMTIPPFAPDPETTRRHFRRLHDLRDTWRRDSGFGLDVLSMGMSHDFEIAIEEGATCVRVGTAICGPRERSEGV